MSEMLAYLDKGYQDPAKAHKDQLRMADLYLDQLRTSDNLTPQQFALLQSRIDYHVRQAASYHKQLYIARQLKKRGLLPTIQQGG